jgi:hypothetical protein
MEYFLAICDYITEYVALGLYWCKICFFANSENEGLALSSMSGSLLVKQNAKLSSLP